jgi:type III secretion system FlhB-like substrate exporter
MMMTDAEIEEAVGLLGGAMRGGDDHSADKAVALLLADTLKKLAVIATALGEIAEAQRVIAKAKAYEIARSGGQL